MRGEIGVGGGTWSKHLVDNVVQGCGSGHWNATAKRPTTMQTRLKNIVPYATLRLFSTSANDSMKCRMAIFARQSDRIYRSSDA